MGLPNYKVWDIFANFVKDETGVGGPDCQLKLLVALGGQDQTTPEISRIWLNGCYGAHHCVPSAYAVWKAFPDPWRVAEEIDEQHRLEDWLEDHWDALPVRPEMRSHRMVHKRAACLIDFAKYAVSEKWRTGEYEDIWNDSIKSVRYYNRYMAIKYIELKRMVSRPELVLGDLRSKHAWSPRIMLGYLFPEDFDVLADRNDNSPYALELAEDCATEALHILKNEYGVEISYFQLQVLSCNAREASEGTFYAGAGHDEEIDYLRLAEKRFDMKDIWETRARIFPHDLLGEKNNWSGIRKEKYKEAKKQWEGLYD